MSKKAASTSAGRASTAAVNEKSITFCVSPILFENCGLLLDPPSGLTTASIMKLRQESSNTTSISLANWRELSATVLGLSESSAYAIFDVFYALSGACIQATPSHYGAITDWSDKSVAEFRQESNRQLLSKMGGAVDEARWPTASTARQVSLSGLTIFLIAQLLLERPPRYPLGEIAQDVVINHVKQYLHDYITAVAATRQGKLVFQDILELRPLLREFVNGVEYPFGTNLAFLWPRNEKLIDVAILAQFIRPRVVHPNDLKIRCEPAYLPLLLKNNVTITGLNDTIHIPPSPLIDPDVLNRFTSSNLTISSCKQTGVYIASALPCVRLSALSNCTVALGPVNGVLAIDRCQQCVISALCGSIVISNCVDVTVFVCTNTPPVVLNGPNTNSPLNHNVRLAPYNTHYSTLEEHLLFTGVNPKLNLWNVGLPSAQYVLPPEEFSPVCFPIAPQGNSVITTRSNPCTIPQPYADALQRRLQRFQDISRDLQEAYVHLEEEGRRDLADSLKQRVHGMFIEWLQNNGQANGLLDLLQK
ncbi:hypothetical protein AGDE_05999 [Angomonas deanei]|uniref:Tubulin binding cofactor C, putative n=1 Tax=Angomonas deanei TaxID=59799 RepID=A0A7G2C755_9TRYP|nr:hypothetical protein AGDE_05999 [Angomonas deanei]CAD2215419.1 Tubulin binding cofactor C, putative [Angomonas deanei]|eukprot:EPY37934.1 hypothetical protein AGDE_05999 [Angomonas deanei]